VQIRADAGINHPSFPTIHAEASSAISDIDMAAICGFPLKLGGARAPSLDLDDVDP
jgi:hypothetical protein